MRSAPYCCAEKLSEGSKRVFASRIEWLASPGGVSRRHGRSDIVLSSTEQKCDTASVLQENSRQSMAGSSQLDRMVASASGSVVIAPPCSYCSLPAFAILLKVALISIDLATAQQVYEGFSKHRVLLLLQ